MATRDGVKLIEYNARFGDPESLNLLTLLQTDFLEICRAIVSESLAEVDVRFSAQASVCKYVVPEGYPETPRKGDVIQLPEELPANATIFLSAVDVEQGKLVATGSRAVAVVGIGETLDNAEAICEGVVREIPGPFFHRTDIGTDSANQWSRGSHEEVAIRMSLKVGVLGSTRGTALQGILDAIAAGALDVELVLVVSDKRTAQILERSELSGVPTLFLDPAGLKRDEFDRHVTDALRQAGAELVLMIGYMRIVSVSFVEEWRGKFAECASVALAGLSRLDESEGA
jgi:hypothetical protein